MTIFVDLGKSLVADDEDEDSEFDVGVVIVIGLVVLLSDVVVLGDVVEGEVVGDVAGLVVGLVVGDVVGDVVGLVVGDVLSVDPFVPAKLVTLSSLAIDHDWVIDSLLVVSV